MKKRLQFTLMAILSFAMAAQSQITITRDDAPKIGDVLTFYADSLPPTEITPGAGGPDRTWDFSQAGLTADDTVTWKVINASNAPNADLFPESNIAIDVDSLFLYGLISDDELLNLGTAIDFPELPTPILARFDPPQKLFQFPTDYEDVYYDTWRIKVQFSGEEFGLAGIDSIRFISSVSDTVTVDAYGSLTTPEEDTYETLRLHTVSGSLDTVSFQIGNAWFDETSASRSESFRWLAKGGKANVFSIFLDEEGIVDDVEWLFATGEVPLAPVASFTYIQSDGGTVGFADNSTNNPTSWLWDFGDGNTSTEQDPTHTYAELNTYNVCLTATNEAGSNTVCQDVDLTASSIETLQRLYGFRLYPNPVRDQLQIELNYPGPERPVIRFSDQLGRQILQQRLSDANPIDMHDWPAGTYPFSVFSADGDLLGSGKVQVTH